jgi:hypothetical protein
MVARIRKNKALVTRIAVMALAAAAFVVVSGLPAQAQPYYNGNPYYGSSCQTYSFGIVGYTTCSPTPYAAPYYYNNYYAPAPYYYNYGGGPLPPMGHNHEGPEH